MILWTIKSPVATAVFWMVFLGAVLSTSVADCLIRRFSLYLLLKILSTFLPTFLPIFLAKEYISN